MPEYRPWTAGQRNSALIIAKRKESIKNHPPVRLDDPTPEDLVACIKEGYCWWCDTGGWKLLAGHTSRKHGIIAKDIRVIAGLFGKTPTCTPEHSSECAIRFTQQLKDGIRKPPTHKPKGYKIKFTKAGRRYQDEVRSPLLKKVRPKAMAILAELRLKGQHFGKAPKPHPCSNCGKPMPFSVPRTCSPKCRKAVRQKTALTSQATIRRLCNENPEYKLKRRENMSESQRKTYNEGRIPHNIKPHPCRICGKRIPTHKPYLCSGECRNKAWHEAQIKAVANRKLKIPISSRAIIAERYQSGESSIAIATEYGISPRYVRLLAKNKVKSDKDNFSVKLYQTDKNGDIWW